MKDLLLPDTCSLIPESRVTSLLAMTSVSWIEQENRLFIYENNDKKRRERRQNKTDFEEKSNAVLLARSN